MFEVNRPNRQLRHQKGKDDTLDAESAARSILAGQATALPKSGTSAVEMIRHLKVARDTAVKARTRPCRRSKPLSSARLGAARATRPPHWQDDAPPPPCRPRPGPLTSTTASAKTGLRAIARRWLALDAEVKDHDAHLEQLTGQLAPELVKAHGMGAGTAAEMLLLVGATASASTLGGPGQAMWRLPDPASSGKTSRHRLNRGGHRQADAALYRVVIVRMRAHQPTLDYVKRRTAEGRQARDHPLPQALRGTRDLWLSLPPVKCSTLSTSGALTIIGHHSDLGL